MNENSGIFHDHLALAELVVEQHVAQSGVGLLHRLCDDHALTGSQSVVLEHGRKRPPGHIVAGRGIVGESPEPGSRDVVFRHQLLGELLGRFDARGRFRRAENPQSRGLERIDDARRQRHLGPHNRQPDALRHGEVAQGLHVGLLDSHALGLPGDTRVAGRAIDFFDLRRTRQRIDDGVLAAARTDYKNFHLFNV